VLGTLAAPALHLSAPVLEGSDDGTLSRGAGHIEDTPFPGEPGNIGIAGHRDTVFRPLKHAKVGDTLELATADRRYRYTITKTLIVGPDDVYVLDPTTSPTLTLVTCYPFEFIGHAPRRFIVQAELIRE
jgi:sortase A